LKDQVKEKDDLHRKLLIDRVAESDGAFANDQKSKLEDNNTKQKKADYLKQFSNENKKVSNTFPRIASWTGAGPKCEAGIKVALHHYQGWKK
jgi:hypothetical protein